MKKVTIIKKWDDGELLALEGHNPADKAIRFVYGYSTGAALGCHCGSETFAEAELGKIDEEHIFTPETVIDGWDPDPTTEDVDWSAYEAWQNRLCEEYL